MGAYKAVAVQLAANIGTEIYVQHERKKLARRNREFAQEQNRQADVERKLLEGREMVQMRKQHRKARAQQVATLTSQGLDAARGGTAAASEQKGNEKFLAKRSQLADAKSVLANKAADIEFKNEKSNSIGIGGAVAQGAVDIYNV